MMGLESNLLKFLASKKYRVQNTMPSGYNHRITEEKGLGILRDRMSYPMSNVLYEKIDIELIAQTFADRGYGAVQDWEETYEGSVIMMNKKDIKELIAFVKREVFLDDL